MTVFCSVYSSLFPIEILGTILDTVNEGMDSNLSKIHNFERLILKNFYESILFESNTTSN